MFFVSQGFGRGVAAMNSNVIRMLTSTGVGLVAVYWLGLGPTGLFPAVALGFCVYAAVMAAAVLRKIGRAHV